MQMDPILMPRSQQRRRSIHHNEEPRINDKENNRRVEPSLLASNDRGRNNPRESANMGAPVGARKTNKPRVKRCDGGRNRGLRRMCSGGRRRVGVIIESSEHDGSQGRKDASHRSQRRVRATLPERLSLSNTSINFDPSIACNNKVKHGMTRLSHMACLIQAAFRGYLGRAKFREHLLLKKLHGIQERKQKELASIKANKEKAMGSLHPSTEETWRNQSEVVTQLTSRVQATREQNSKLKKQVAHLKEDNRQLAIANSAVLTAAGQLERRVNRIEHYGLQVHEVARTYRDALQTGKQMLRYLVNDTSGFNFEENHHDDALEEIEKMIQLAKAEDAPRRHRERCHTV